MKKIVVINGHPDKDRFNTEIANVYIKKALSMGAEVRYIAIGELNFNPNLKFGYKQRTELEPDLIKALDDIFWADHLVWIHPIWWLGMPAIMKGFIDRIFLPGFTFKSNKNLPSEGLLKGKTGRIITTAGDMTLEIYQNEYQSSGLIQLKKGVLEYCGVTDIKSFFIGPLQDFNEEKYSKSLKMIQALVLDDLR